MNKKTKQHVNRSVRVNTLNEGNLITDIQR
jgi:hypothetical protein